MHSEEVPGMYVSIPDMDALGYFLRRGFSQFGSLKITRTTQKQVDDHEDLVTHQIYSRSISRIFWGMAFRMCFKDSLHGRSGFDLQAPNTGERSSGPFLA